MRNVEFKTQAGKLVITVDISAEAVKTAPLSSTGKTALVGTTGGATAIPMPNGASLSFALNVMAKR